MRFTSEGAPVNRSNMIAVVGSFVAGILVTIASLSYLRTQELSQFRKAVRISRPLNTEPTAVTGTSSAAGNADLPTGNPFDELVHRIELPTERHPIQVPKRMVPTHVPQTHKTAQRSSEIAQNAPGPNIAAPL